MGQHTVTITIYGNHGCDRDAREGEDLRTTLCDYALTGCSDCRFRKLVQELLASGVDVEEAALVHWPDSPGVVVDDLVAGKRVSGQFPTPG